MTFQEQHRSLLQFAGVLSLFKPGMSERVKLDMIDKYWEPSIRETMVYWLTVCYDKETVPFEPIPFSRGSRMCLYRENPLTTPMELVDMLAEELNKEEALEILKVMEGNLFTPAYEMFRRILARSLSSCYVDKDLAAVISDTL